MSPSSTGRNRQTDLDDRLRGRLPSDAWHETHVESPAAEVSNRAHVARNVEDDPTEHINLAHDPKYAATLKSLQETLEALNKEALRRFSVAALGRQLETSCSRGPLQSRSRPRSHRGAAATSLCVPQRAESFCQACEVAIEQSRTFGPFVESKDISGVGRFSVFERDAEGFQDRMDDTSTAVYLIPTRGKSSACTSTIDAVSTRSCEFRHSEDLRA